MTKVCLIKPKCKELLDDKMDIPYGVLCLASAIKQCGYEVTITDLSGNGEYDKIPEADIFGISTNSVTYSEAINIKDWIKKNHPGIPVVIGGAHSTVEYKNISNDFDAIFVGEGEITFPASIESIIKKENEKVIYCQEVDNLDDFKLDYSLINIDEYHRTNGNKKTISLMTSRGCIFKCKYCWNFRNATKVRYRSYESMKEEITLLKNKYGIQHICILDDSFLTDLERAKKIMQCMKDLKLTWEAECNIIHLQSYELCEYMKDCGCTNVFFGMESGSERMLRIINKPQTKDIIRKGVANLKKSGIIVRGSIMVGFPGETWESVYETIELVKEIQLDEYVVYTFTPYPGTDPYYNPEKYGIEILAKEYSDFFMLKGNADSSYCFKSESLNPQIIKEMKNYIFTEIDSSRRSDQVRSKYEKAKS